MRLTGFNSKDMRKCKEETQRSMTLLFISLLCQTEEIRKCLNLFCMCDMFWLSEEKKQIRLTEWCKAVENKCIEEKKRSPVSVPSYPRLCTSSQDRGDSTYNKLVNQNTHTTP